MSTTLNAQYWIADPTYGQVYKILLGNSLGSWAAADELYTQIRTRAIWSELNTMTAKKPTPTATERATELLDELNRLSGSQGAFADATNVVKTWAPPSGPRIVAVKKPAVVNTFAALAEEDEE